MATSAALVEPHGVRGAPWRTHTGFFRVLDARKSLPSARVVIGEISTARSSAPPPAGESTSAKPDVDIKPRRAVDVCMPRARLDTGSVGAKRKK
jgi:hypothetical protein